MKNRDIQQVVLQLHDDSYRDRQLSRELRNIVLSRTIYRWVKMYEEADEINLKRPSGSK